MKKLLKAKAVIFDRDGIIINTEPVLIDSVKKAFKKLGFTLQKEDIAQLIGRSYDVYKDYFLAKWDFDFDRYREIQKEIYYKNLDKAEYFKHTLDLIKALHKNKIPIAVTTSAGRDGTLLMLNQVGITKMFDVIVTKEDCKNLKPHPEPYLTTAKKLKIDPRDCLVLEDTALGVESAKKAGMICIAVPNEFTKDQDFSMADTTVQSAKEVLSIVEFIAK